MTDVIVAGEFYSAFPERRINPFKPEVRMVEGTNSGRIVGYASVFNKLSRKLGGFVEKVNPRAFAQSKTENWPDVVCRYNHNDDFLLGTTRAGTCLIDFDDTGLMYDVDPPSFRSDIVELCQRGDCQHSSFAFRVPEGGDDWGLSDFSYPLRTLLNVELVDVAPVITPAYPDATAATRAVDGAVQSLSLRFQAEPAEIRSLLESNMGVKLFKRSDRPSVPVVNGTYTTGSTAANVTITSITGSETPQEAEMTPDELRAAWYEAEIRAKYDEAQMKKMSKSGETMPNSSGEPSYPIADEEDLHNAIHAVGRGHASHEAIRKHIIARAKALGLTHLLPASWTGGDENDEQNSAEETAEDRAAAAAASDSDADDEGGDTDADEDDEDEDSEDSAGKGTESQGRSGEENSEERSEMEQATSANGLSDNDHKVDAAADNRRRLAILQEKRFDPYLDSDEE